MEKNLSDIRLLQLAEMKSLCGWAEERLKDIHFKITILLDESSDKEIEEYMKKVQPFFVFLKQIGSDSESWIGGSTKRVLEYYNKEKIDNPCNKLDVLFREEGSKLENYIHITK
jgi:hypothetical protein